MSASAFDRTSATQTVTLKVAGECGLVQHLLLRGVASVCTSLVTICWLAGCTDTTHSALEGLAGEQECETAQPAHARLPYVTLRCSAVGCSSRCMLSARCMTPHTLSEPVIRRALTGRPLSATGIMNYVKIHTSAIRMRCPEQLS